MKKLFPLTTFLLAGFLIYAQGVEGVWYNTDKSGKIEIYKEANGSYSGKIVWLDEPLDSNGKPKVNENDKDETRRSLPIIGLVVMEGFTKDGEDKYTGGTIYDPENGKTYKCKLTLENENNLDVRGYVGVPAFGRTEHWTRTK